MSVWASRGINSMQAQVPEKERWAEKELQSVPFKYTIMYWSAQVGEENNSGWQVNHLQRLGRIVPDT